MNRKTSERCALAALISMVIYGLACMYPIAWSPDSQKLVFLVPGEEEGIEALVMTDLSAKPIREVARVKGEDATLSTAAWSPDGKWIAYLKFEEKPVSGGEVEGKDETNTIVRSLMVQASDSGKEYSILRDEVVGWKKVFAETSDLFWGPQWTNDSKSVMTWSVSEGKPGLVFLDLNGKVERKLPLDGEGLAAWSATLSPNGKYVAYLKSVKDEDDPAILIAAELGEKGIRQVLSPVAFGDKDGMMSRPGWSPDSQFLYAPTPIKKTDKKDKACVVKRFSIPGGEAEVVWQKEDTFACGVSVSAKSGRLAVVYRDEGADVFAIDTVDPQSGESTPVHFGEPAMGTTISPDGKWVAFLPSADNGKQKCPIGAIVSSDGSKLRFLTTEKEQEAAIPGILKERLAGALKHLLRKELGAAWKQADQVASQQDLQKALAELDELTRKQTPAEKGKGTAPLLREALDCSKALICIEYLQKADLPAAERNAVVAEVRQHLAAFLKVRPRHPLGPGLAKEIEEAAKMEPKKAQKPPNPPDKAK